MILHRSMYCNVVDASAVWSCELYPSRDSIKYEYDPKDDNFVKNVADKYNVAKLNVEMIGTYKDFEGFLKELYKHEHFLDISSVEIVPYQKDRKILIIKFQLKLYAQK